MARTVPPAIVLAAYNRPDQLRRLCASLGLATIAADTPLVISIDGGGSRLDQVCAVADAVDWTHGPKQVTVHEHLGLVDHFWACGDLTTEFGDIVLLEDDLIVAPSFQRWAIAALDNSRSDDRIAGVSLATPFFDGYRHLPFEPVIDGSDGIYAQIPWYDGMAWTADMWRQFRSANVDPATPLHKSLATLDDDEWFPEAMRYLVSTDRFYLLPRLAQASNSGAAGAHFAEATNYFQVPLTLRGPKAWRLHSVDDALALYDDHLELTPHALGELVPSLANIDVCVDLAGVRDLSSVTATHILTTRRVRKPVRLWGASMHPLVANLTHNVPGDAIRLAATGDVIDSAESDQEAAATLAIHASRGQTPSNKEALRHLTAGLKSKLTKRRLTRGD